MYKQQIAVVGSMDSSGGAGINQDIRIATLLDTAVQTCVGALTIQSSLGVESIHPTAFSVFQTNLESILRHPDLHYLKIGALSQIEQIECLCARLKQPRERIVVLDPVIRPSRGVAFLDEEGIEALRKLAQVADYVCPNLPELLALAGKADADPVEVAQDYANLTGTKLLLTGGHAAGSSVEDRLYDGKDTRSCIHPRQNWGYSHGTGCAFSMAFTCFLARGYSTEKAFRSASQWVYEYYNRVNGITFPEG